MCGSYGGGLLVALAMVGSWIVLVLVQPATLAYYPIGWERIIAPAVCAVFNQWIAPTVVRSPSLSLLMPSLSVYVPANARAQ